MVDPQGAFYKVRADDGNLLHPAPANIDARRILAPGVVPATAALVKIRQTKLEDAG